MARFDFKLPDVGEGVAEAEITAWHVAVGDTVKEDQRIADVMTDKATVEMEAPVAGTIVALGGKVGERIAIGSLLVAIETERRSDAGSIASNVGSGETSSAGSARTSGAENRKPPASAASRDLAERPSVSVNKPTVLASPAVRQRARDLGIDLALVQGSSERIRHSDLDSYLLYHGGTAPAARKSRVNELVDLTGLRRKIAENMAEAKRRIPHFTLVEEFDVEALEETRAMLNRDRGDEPKLTLLSFLITAIAKAVADWPMLNATFDDQTMRVTRHGAVHLGMATQTSGGLMVPVIRHAEAMTLSQLAAEIIRLAEAARSGKVSHDELGGSTITISSLGPLGGISSTPVINRPEVAIIAVNKIEQRAVIVDGELEARKRMNLSLSCDHRVVDGWDAANFLAAIKALIENPLRLLSA